MGDDDEGAAIEVEIENFTGRALLVEHRWEGVEDADFTAPAGAEPKVVLTITTHEDDGGDRPRSGPWALKITGSVIRCGACGDTLVYDQADLLTSVELIEGAVAEHLQTCPRAT